MCSPPHTISDANTSAADSIASAHSAYVLPMIPAVSFTPARAALISMPTCAARIPRSAADAAGNVCWAGEVGVGSTLEISPVAANTPAGREEHARLVCAHRADRSAYRAAWADLLRYACSFSV